MNSIFLKSSSSLPSTFCISQALQAAPGVIVVSDNFNRSDSVCPATPRKFSQMKNDFHLSPSTLSCRCLRLHPKCHASHRFQMNLTIEGLCTSQLKPPPLRSRGRVGDLTFTPVKRHQYPYPLRLEVRSNAPTPAARKMKISKLS